MRISLWYFPLCIIIPLMTRIQTFNVIVSIISLLLLTFLWLSGKGSTIKVKFSFILLFSLQIRIRTYKRKNSLHIIYNKFRMSTMIRNIQKFQIKLLLCEGGSMDYADAGILPYYMWILPLGPWNIIQGKLTMNIS